MIDLKRRKLLYGIGINDADYVTQPSKGQRCPFYNKWHSMLRRCYSENSLIRNPLYENVFVDEKWWVFSNFKSWMGKQDWEGKHLDKDLIGNGLLYSEDTCLFVSSRVNVFIGEKMVGEFPGTYVKFNDGRINRVVSQISGAEGKLHLGVYPSQIQAHRAWQQEKITQAKILIEMENDFRVKSALIKIVKKIEEDISNGNITRRLK